MKRITLLISLFTLIASGLYAQKKYIPKRSDYTFRTQVCTSTDDEGNTVTDSIITYVTNRQGTYTIVSHTMPLDPQYYNGFGDIVEDDINFDGIPDLMICLGPTNAYGGFTYDGYAWDTKRHCFVMIENFYDILDPVFDKKTKTITGTFRVGNECEISNYKLKKNKVVYINGERMKCDEIEW